MPLGFVHVLCSAWNVLHLHVCPGGIFLMPWKTAHMMLLPQGTHASLSRWDVPLWVPGPQNILFLLWEIF